MQRVGELSRGLPITPSSLSGHVLEDGAYMAILLGFFVFIGGSLCSHSFLHGPSNYSFARDFPVYHTAFDSYEWMIAHGDPFFHRHVAVSGVWGLLALHLADDPILPFNYLSYAAQLQEHISALSGLLEGNNVSLGPLYTSLGQLFSAAREIEEVEKLGVNGSSSVLMVMKRRMLNDRLMLAERGLLDPDGLHSMRWFKHLVYGPCGEYESKLSVLPGIADAAYRSMQMGKEEREAIIQHEIWRVARAIQRAADALRGQLI
ncbi:hypothetical protein Nepgr_012520 [Nepenthes gracilis]|uniref:Transferrin receptor-like dimerisation domain-containing protein n=1 Tax=Nepenthes gracilis TaxID=150966 RepID=A0AAD3XN77_NEPGR|nr:hypothetical protein Nepgr_012520 [Nepenthes gracilis]